MTQWIKASLLALAIVAGVASMPAATLTVPAGSQISIRMTDPLDSKFSHAGETFRAVVDVPLEVNGKIVVPKGAEAIGRVIDVASSGRFRGRPMIAVELTALNFDGKSVGIRTSYYQHAGSSRGRLTARITGGATVAGTIIGAVAGAPFIGTGIGAAAGMAVQSVRGRDDIRIPAESLLLFTLQSPLPVDDAM
jgi:hypothetical protein